MGYSSVCLARSALNPVVSIQGGVDVSNHPLVARLVKGVFHSRPPLPRYTEVWDIGKVINYVRNLGDNGRMSLKELTLKVTTLISILTCQRVSSVTQLSVSNTHLEGEQVTFVPVRLAKHDRPGRKIRKITVKAYPEDPNVCIVQALRSYMDRRPTRSEDQLLLTHRKPVKAASKDTIARWLKQVLVLAGVSDTIFGAHSYRGASSSGAKIASVPISKILRRGQWASEDTWRRHYDLNVQGYPSSDEEDETTNPLLDRFAV